MQVHQFKTSCDGSMELEVGATQGGGDPLVRTYDGRHLEGYFHKMRVEEHAAFMNAILGQVPV